MIAIVTCEASDFDAMAAGIDLLRNFGLAYELVAIDPSKTPEGIVEYAESARGRGVSCILAGTGNAPALPALLTTHTSLPVIGIPLPCRILGGQHPPISLVHMPAQVPVATVGSGDAQAAALAAVRFLAATDDALRRKLEQFLGQDPDEVRDSI